MNTYKRSYCGPQCRAFSLVEVVLAVGIMTFAIVVLGGLYGNLISRHKDNNDRQESVRAVAALNEFLSGADSFATVSDWLPGTNSTKDLHYVMFRADTQGEPDTSSARVSARWIAGENGEPSPASLDAAREGSWIRAILKKNASITNASSLFLDAKLYEVSFPSQELPANAAPLMVVPIIVTP